jgi:hypothetical protein
MSLEQLGGWKVGDKITILGTTGFVTKVFRRDKNGIVYLQVKTEDGTIYNEIPRAGVWE